MLRWFQRIVPKRMRVSYSSICNGFCYNDQNVAYMLGLTVMDAKNTPRLDPRLAQRLIEKKARLDRQRPLSAEVVDRLHGELRVLLTYHSNAIKGSPLSLRETRMIIERRLAMGWHHLRDYLEATNHAAAYDLLTTLADSQQELTIDTILTLHCLTMDRLLEESGQFRTTDVSIAGVQLLPPPALQVPSLMQEWLAWVADDGLAYNTVLRTAIAHHRFEAMHPFIEGNGRVSRLLLNLLLMRDGYPPALLLRDWRVGYMRALSAADTGNYTPLVNLIGRAVEQGLDWYLEACAAVLVATYYRLSDLAAMTEYSVDHLGWLARQGRLEAVKRGGRWYSTVAAVERYRAEVAGEIIIEGGLNSTQ